jgi:hypothetical protein
LLPADPGLPDAAELLAGVGAQAVARLLDGRGLEPRRVEPSQAHYRPGHWLAVCFRAEAVERSTGRPVDLTVTVERRAAEPDAVWAFPDDPALPGLAAAADPALVGRRLGVPPGQVAVDVVRYRPRRRAVLRYRVSPGGRVVLAKVVRPARGRRLLALAAALTVEEGTEVAVRADGTGGSPPDREATARRVAPAAGLRLGLPAGRLAPGALVLPFLAGSSLRDLLLTGSPLPPPDRLAGLPGDLNRRCLPALAGPAPAPEGAAGRPALRRRVCPITALSAARLAARLLPEEGCAAGRLAEAVVAWSEASEPVDDWIVHGDLYENQVLVDGESLGLIDLDDLGPGDPLLDAANFSAHLLLLGTSAPATGPTILRYRDELRAAFSRRFDAGPFDLAWREAYCLLRLAAGPFRVLHPDWPRRVATRLSLATDALSGR